MANQSEAAVSYTAGDRVPLANGDGESSRQGVAPLCLANCYQGNEVQCCLVLFLERSGKSDFVGQISAF